MKKKEKILTKLRQKDFSIKGEAVDALNLWQQQHFSSPSSLICSAPNEILLQISRNKSKYFLSQTPIICYVNSLMWCMMQGVCGQCVQVYNRTQDTTNQSFFSCACQRLEIDAIDFHNTTSRLKQNSLFEKLNRY